MLFRRLVFAGVLLLPLLNSVSSQGDIPSGEVCDSDEDCTGNLDCIRTGLFEKRCFPITCAKGAAQAMVDYGFNADDYIDRVIGDAGMSKTDYVLMTSKDSSHLFQAMEADVPPLLKSSTKTSRIV
jgi:hypothetical protein